MTKKMIDVRSCIQNQHSQCQRHLLQCHVFIFFLNFDREEYCLISAGTKIHKRGARYYLLQTDFAESFSIICYFLKMSQVKGIIPLEHSFQLKSL